MQKESAEGGTEEGCRRRVPEKGAELGCRGDVSHGDGGEDVDSMYMTVHIVYDSIIA